MRFARALIFRKVFRPVDQPRFETRCELGFPVSCAAEIECGGSSIYWTPDQVLFISDSCRLADQSLAECHILAFLEDFCVDLELLSSKSMLLQLSVSPHSC